MIRTAILIIFGGGLLLLSLRSLRAMRLKERYVLLFASVGLPFLALAIWPDGILWVADALQMEKATFMILCLGVFTILLLLKLLSVVSVQERQIAALTQIVGILSEEQNMKVTTDSAPKSD